MDYQTISTTEQWVYHPADDGISISLQRKVGGSWTTAARYWRPLEKPMNGHHYVAFRNKFAKDANYREQYKLQETQIMSDEQTNGAQAEAQPGPGFTEAPASATARMVSPAGIEWLLTTRDATVSGLMSKVQYLENYLIDHNWQASAGRAGSPATNGNGSGPLCPTHNKPMQPSKHGGGFYCPVKIADNDGTGKPLYCKAKA